MYKEWDFSTFTYYDFKGRRLSIFGLIKEDKILVTVIPCSKNDPFIKRVAKDLYKNGVGDVLLIPGNTQKDFFNYVKQTYYKKLTTHVQVYADKILNISVQDFKWNTKRLEITTLCK